MDTQRFPLIAQCEQAHDWLTVLEGLGRAKATLEAYARALSDYLEFCRKKGLDPLQAQLEQISLYVRYLNGPKSGETSRQLSNATIQQRLTAVRLFYDHLYYAGLCERNPVPRARQIGCSSFRSPGPGALVKRIQNLPRIPTDDQWQTLLQTAREEPLRNRVMLALAYYGALRREELVNLQIGDFDVARRLVHVRAETTKSGRARVVGYAPAASAALMAYFHRRRLISRDAGSLFLSESNRNRGEGLSIWSWSKVVQDIARRAGITNFSTHTLRHLRLTDLARAGWTLHEICRYAGHQNPQTTMIYVHLSGHDLSRRMSETMAVVDARIGALLCNAL